MTEWEKKEEVHCQALEDAEKVIRGLIEAYGVMLEGMEMCGLDAIPDSFDRAVVMMESWLKKYCEGGK